MSGVYIRGMEMPKSCYFCPCNKDDGFGFFTCGVTKSECDFLNLPSDCPLSPIPPHGRLIDADAFEKHIKEDWEEYDHWIAVEVENRPTVLEAEEGE